MSEGRRPFGEGPLFQVTTAVYWFLVVEVLLVATTLPGLVLAFLLAPEPSNLPLFALAALPVGPALAAAFYTWRRFSTQQDQGPARVFARGYRLNLADSLRTWVPVVGVLLVLGMNMSFGEATGFGALSWVWAALGVAVLLWGLRMLSITSVFVFRWRDAGRIAVYTLIVRPVATLALLSYLVLVAGLTVVTFDAVVVLLASLLTFAVARSERPVITRVHEQFVTE